MFTIDQIKEAHSKVKSGADFPGYVQELIKLGVLYYDTYPLDGHAVFTGNDTHTVQQNAKYDTIDVPVKIDAELFKHYLKIHQLGQTDYFTFCRHAVETGIEKWTVDTKMMTCTYYDKVGNMVLEELIPTL